MKLLLAVFVTAANIGPTVARAAAPDSLCCGTTYHYAMHLFETGDHYRAISEFKRVSYFCAERVLRQNANYMIPLSQYSAGRYGDALNGFRAYAQEASDLRLIEATQFYRGRCWDRLGQHEAAQQVFRGASIEDTIIHERVQFALGWSQFLNGDWSAAHESLGRFALDFPEAPLRPLASRIAGNLGVDSPFGQKSVALGAMLSIVPGGGQSYAGQYGDAVYALLITAISAAIAIRGANTDSSSVLAIGAALTVSFYLGNIYGGANSVATRNARIIDDARRSFQSELARAPFDDPLLPRVTKSP